MKRNDPREPWDRYFLAMAAHAATRSTCVRRQVGAVLTQDNRVRATGYNGSPAGYGHCFEGACPRGRADAPVRSAKAMTELHGDYGDCIAVHAEANALLAAELKHRDASVLYATEAPCFGCAKLVAQSGVQRVVYGDRTYPGWDAVRDFLRDCRVLVGEPEPVPDIGVPTIGEKLGLVAHEEETDLIQPGGDR